jgi:hypothetical protein
MEKDVNKNALLERVYPKGYYEVVYSDDFKAGAARVRIPEGIDTETYTGEFVDSLIRNGYTKVIRFDELKLSGLYSFYFTKDSRGKNV